jgi:hypothetical protein
MKVTYTSCCSHMPPWFLFLYSYKQSIHHHQLQPTNDPNHCPPPPSNKQVACAAGERALASFKHRLRAGQATRTESRGNTGAAVQWPRRGPRSSEEAEAARIRGHDFGRVTPSRVGRRWLVSRRCQKFFFLSRVGQRTVGGGWWAQNRYRGG